MRRYLESLKWPFGAKSCKYRLKSFPYFFRGNFDIVSIEYYAWKWKRLWVCFWSFYSKKRRRKKRTKIKIKKKENKINFLICKETQLTLKLTCAGALRQTYFFNLALQTKIWFVITSKSNLDTFCLIWSSTDRYRSQHKKGNSLQVMNCTIKFSHTWFCVLFHVQFHFLTG